MDNAVRIVEVGPRDGLQNEPTIVPTSDKIALINLLSSSGLQSIEVSSFVSPKWVPQLADAADVFAGIERRAGVRYVALVPNMMGLERAIEAGVGEVAVFASASEPFSMKNTNGTIPEVLERLREVAKASPVPVRGYVSCIDSDPYAGEVTPDAVLRVCEELLEMGCYEVSLGDTTGKAPKERMDQLLQHLLRTLSADRLAGHFHDSTDTALENVEVALAHGLRVFDAAVGGLGGCPYAPGAKGNLSSLKLIEFLETKGFETGVDGSVVAKAGQMVQSWKENT